MFRLVKIKNGRINVPEMMRLPVTADETYQDGEALIISSGKATKCSATATPTHICTETRSTASEKDIWVYEISDGMIFETPISAAPASLVLGDKVTLHTDGASVTATKTNGVATIYDLQGASAANEKILVKF